MSERAATGAGDATRYVIRVRGRLDPRWTRQLDGWSLTHTDDGSSLLDGPLVDQAALHGVLRRLADLGLPLISVIPADVSSHDDPR